MKLFHLEPNPDFHAITMFSLIILEPIGVVKLSASQKSTFYNFFKFAHLTENGDIMCKLNYIVWSLIQDGGSSFRNSEGRIPHNPLVRRCEYRMPSANNIHSPLPLYAYSTLQRPVSQGCQNGCYSNVSPVWLLASRVSQVLAVYMIAAGRQRAWCYTNTHPYLMICPK